MGRLQALSGFAFAVSFAVLAAVGCNTTDKQSPPPPNKRSEAVLAPSSTAPTRPTPTQSAVRPTAVSRPRNVCPGPSLNRALPSEKLSHAEAAGAPPLGDTIPVGSGKWTWINLWAAYCVPCREEMPRLLQWQNRLAATMALQFVSLDDDQRQLMRLLESQPTSGVRASFWLPDGNGRESWLGALRLKTSPQLPVQILVNPQGRVHCIIEGAVEDSDFGQVSAIVGQR